MSRTIIRKNNPIIPKMPEIGRLYKGGPKGTSSRGYAGGDDYASPYIRFEPDEGLKYHPSTDGSENLYEQLKQSWELLISEGHVRIQFPFSTIEENFPYTNRLTKVIGGVSKTMRECDGHTCTRWTENAPHPTKPGQTIPKLKKGSIPCAAQEGKECPMGCQPHGMLKLMIRQLYPGGVVLFPLNSVVDITAIAGYLEPYRNYELDSLPFVLFRRETVISYEEKGEMKQKKNWGLHLAIDPAVSMMMLRAKESKFIDHLDQGIIPGHDSPKMISPASDPDLQDKLPNFRKSDDGLRFQSQVQESIRKGSLELLDLAVDDAMELIHGGFYEFRPSVEFVDREVDRAKEAISQASPPAPAPAPRKKAGQTQPAEKTEDQPNPTLVRLGSLRDMTGFTKSMVKTLSEEIGLDVTQAPSWTEDDVLKFRRSLFVAATAKLGSLEPAIAAEKVDAVLAADSTSDLNIGDRELWNQLSNGEVPPF